MATGTTQPALGPHGQALNTLLRFAVHVRRGLEDAIAADSVAAAPEVGSEPVASYAEQAALEQFYRDTNDANTLATLCADAMSSAEDAGRLELLRPIIGELRAGIQGLMDTTLRNRSISEDALRRHGEACRDAIEVLESMRPNRRNDGTPPPRLTVNVERNTATLDGKEYTVKTELAARWLKVLADNPGKWIRSGELSQYDAMLINTRTDRLKGKFPRALQRLIESETGDGSRLVLPALA